MAHIPDGVVSLPVLIGGWTVAAAGLGLGLRRLTPDRLPQAALVAAAFFVASLVHFPVGVTSVHPLLGGLAGLMLDWAAFPVIAVGLILQAVLFGFGGLTTLGLNLADMAVPAVAFGLVGRALLRRPGLAGAVAGAGAVLGTAVLIALALALSGREFQVASRLLVLTYLPLAVVEAVATAAIVGLLAKVRPEALGAGR